jgi:hypothetical protein
MRSTSTADVSRNTSNGRKLLGITLEELQTPRSVILGTVKLGGQRSGDARAFARLTGKKPEHPGRSDEGSRYGASPAIPSL